MLPVIAQAGGALPVLRHNRQVQELTIPEAARQYPVTVKGIITYVNPGTGDMFVQDATAGVFVFVNRSRSEVPLRPGQLVALQGVSTPADFSPSITHAVIQVLGFGAMPRPKRLPFNELLAGKQDGQWIQTEGVVRSGEIKDHLLFLNVATAGGSFLMITPDFSKDWQPTLVDSKITVNGVLAAIFNEKRQSVSFRVFVPSRAYVHTEEAASANSFDLPLTSALSVGQYHPRADLERRIRVRATLLAADSGNSLFVSDGQGGLQVEEYAGCGARPGDLIDVVGFPASVDSRPGLQDSICRKIGPGFDAPPIAVSAQQVIPNSVSRDASGYGLSVGTRYDLKLVSIDATLLETSPAFDGETWSLESDSRNFIARIPRYTAKTAPPAEIGSRVRLTGLCVLTYDHYRRAQSFRVLVRHRGDIAVLAAPRLRSLRSVLWTLGVLASACLCAFAWITLLKRQVKQKTAQLELANASLTRLSNVDPLTGTANRRFFDEKLKAELSRASRSGEPLALLMIDVDHFKAINDAFGHPRGDECLVRVARALRSISQRGADLIARFGGEEFAVILPGADRDGALIVAESIRQRVLDLMIPNPASSFQVLSVSIGIAAARSGDSAAAEALVSRADAALYSAKRSGRNQVRLATDSTEPLAPAPQVPPNRMEPLQPAWTEGQAFP